MAPFLSIKSGSFPAGSISKTHLQRQEQCIPFETTAIEVVELLMMDMLKKYSHCSYWTAEMWSKLETPIDLVHISLKFTGIMMQLQPV